MGIEEERVDLEEELVEVGLRPDVTDLLRDPQFVDEATLPAAIELGDPLLDRSWPGLDLRGCGGKEAAARKDPSVEMIQERIGESDDGRDFAFGARRLSHDDLVEDLLRTIDRRELELFLEPK